MFPLGVRLSIKATNALNVELKARLKDVSRNMMGHQLAVRLKKSSKFRANI